MGFAAAEIQMTDLTKVFAGSGPVFEKPISLQIQSGEFVSILGPSGCGKSTLLRLIGGLESASSGQIHSPSNAKKSFVFQEANLLPWRTCLQNVMLPLELKKEPSASTQALEVLSRVDLEDAKNLYPAELSGGMKMRVSLARALVNKPSLLLLDEPFSALDENTRFKLQEDLRKLWIELGMTVVFVTHSVSEAVFLSNRCLVLSKKPSRMILDHPIELPKERTEALRLDPSFVSQMKVMQNSMSRGIE